MPAKGKELLFVVQKHNASHLHYDLRIEKDGVLKSWAVPKEPPCEAGIKRLAIEVDDHDISYAHFEGTIPEGTYGAGTVTVWDSGTYSLVNEKSGEYVIHIHGRKMNGIYCLIKLKKASAKKTEWLLFKKE